MATLLTFQHIVKYTSNIRNYFFICHRKHDKTMNLYSNYKVLLWCNTNCRFWRRKLIILYRALKAIIKKKSERFVIRAMTTDRRTYSRRIFPYILILFLSEAWIFDIEFMLCPLNHCSMVNILSMSVSIRYSIRHLRIKYMFPIHIFETFLTGKVRWSVHQSRQWCSGNYVLYTLCRKTININSSITFYLLHSTNMYILK